MGLSGKAKTIPADFMVVQLCEAMGCTYLELLKQPKKFIELYVIYLTVKGKIAEEETKKAKMQYKRGK